MPQFKDTGKPRGFFFVQFRKEEDAHESIKSLNGKVCHHFLDFLLVFSLPTSYTEVCVYLVCIPLIVLLLALYHWGIFEKACFSLSLSLSLSLSCFPC